MFATCLQTALPREIQSRSSPLTGCAYVKSVYYSIFHMLFRKGSIHTRLRKNGCVFHSAHVLAEHTCIYSPLSASQKPPPFHLYRCPGNRVPCLRY